MINKESFLLFCYVLVSLHFISCNLTNQRESGNANQHKVTDKVVLERILRDGKLIATTDYNSTNYFVYRGEPMGYQYELLKTFADELGVKLEIKIINDIQQSFECINRDQCDLIALGIIVTKEQSKLVDFSIPLDQTRQMLIQKKPPNWRKMSTKDQVEKNLIRNTLSLAGATIHIPKNTVYLSRLLTISEEIAADIHILEHPDATVEDLIAMVARGEIEYTICDEHVALVNQKYYPDIDVFTPVSFPQNMAWAVKKGATGLLDTLNFWLENYKKTRSYAYLYNKYFKNSRSVNIARNNFNPSVSSGISPFDDIIKKYSSLIDWDWRLLASLIYQESRFYPDTIAWSGAFGLMQLMPHTAAKYGIDTLSPPEEQIKAGVKFIGLLDEQFQENIKDKEERTKFVLASYNAGIAHVYDARRLAQKYKKDPNIWDENVDFYLLNKSKPEYFNDSVVKYGYCRGVESYRFVNDVLDRFEHYKNISVN
jgi:membrane-bound lytic murein transglycosylase F